MKDFADPQTFLDPTFNGDHILPSGNTNWSQLDDPGLNQRMADAALLTDPAERAQAWADIDHRITGLRRGPVALAQASQHPLGERRRHDRRRQRGLVARRI